MNLIVLAIQFTREKKVEYEAPTESNDWDEEVDVREDKLEEPNLFKVVFLKYYHLDVIYC